MNVESKLLQDVDNLRPLRELGSDYFQKSLFKQEIKKVTYNKNRAPWGVTRTGQIFAIDTTVAPRILVVGMTGSGKTFSIRQFCDRIHTTGKNLVYLTDVKDEYKSSRFPVQKKFQDHLAANEIPTGMKIVTFRPTFFKDTDKKLPKNNYWISVDISKLSKTDFMSLIGYEGLTEPQKNMLEMIYTKMYKNFRKQPELFKLKFFEKFIYEMPKRTTKEKDAMYFKFKFLEDCYLYEKEWIRDLVSIINKGYAIAFNFEGYRNYLKGKRYHQLFVAIILREIITARQKGLIKPTWIVVDEAPRFIPDKGNTICKHDFLESADVDRKYGVSYIYATQTVDKLPVALIKQCRYLFLPYNLNVTTIREVLVQNALAHNLQRSPNDALYLKKMLRKYEWAVIDNTIMKSLTDIRIIRPFAPLSMHAEASK